jgi:hypothetical protein
VKKIFHECGYCRKLKAVPKLPQMADLPEFRRTACVPLFAHTVLDFFGPMLVKIGRRQEKRCLNSTAGLFTLSSLHPFLLSLLSAIMAIRRFRGRRDDVKVMYSDNGTNLRGAEAEMKKTILDLDGNRLTREFADVKMKWKFNLPAAPHFGGIWERLIKTVKKLYADLNEKKPCRHYWLKWSIE